MAERCARIHSELGQPWFGLPAQAISSLERSLRLDATAPFRAPRTRRDPVSPFGQEPQDLVHDGVGEDGIEHELCVCGALQHDELFWLWSAFEDLAKAQDSAS
jgi:hypothetical protein